MRLSSVLVSACLLAAASFAGRPKRQSEPPLECLDDTQRPGTCVAISDCPALYRLIEDDRRPSADEFEFLKRKVCRTTNKILLCCASQSPDLHPNRKLLEEGKLCGTSIVPRIRNGEEVRLGQYPWMAVFFYTNIITGKVEPLCGGSLIGLQHVLTAAHCVTDIGNFVLSSVRLGEHDLRQEEDCQLQKDSTILCNAPQNFTVEQVFIHEDYNNPKVRDNDIALLKLDRPVVEDNFIGKICLPFGTAQHRDYTGVNLTVAGFGRLGPNNNSPSSDVLMELTLFGQNQQSCGRIIRRREGTLSNKQICAGGRPGRDSCPGDSGGPLMAVTPTGPPYSLIGVVSFGAFRCGEGNIPSVNTRVSEYMNWILDRVDD